MIKSMTGYGKAVCELEGKKITIEIKSLNSKNLDLSTRISSIYKEKELEIRSIVSKRLQRGKIDICLKLERTGPEATSSINTEVVKGYCKQLKELDADMSTPNHLLEIALRLPDSLKVEQEEIDEKEWKAIVNSANEAIDDIESFRMQEGDVLKSDFQLRINNIVSLHKEIDKFEKPRIEKVRQRILDKLNDLSEDINFDKNRFEQELIFYIEKLDITEEKIRLANHCNYFLETLNNGDDAVGKKLNFISQEIGREINTMGSKANDSGMQQVVVRMKDELEKIKEQSLNIL